MIEFSVEESYYSCEDSGTFTFHVTTHDPHTVNFLQYMLNFLNEYNTSSSDTVLNTVVKEMFNNKQYLIAGRGAGKSMYTSAYRSLRAMSVLKEIIYSGPCTILMTETGGKTIVRCTKSEKFDHEKGAMMAFLKRYLSEEQWKIFTDEYHDTPKKEKDAAKALIIVGFGRDTYDYLMYLANDGWERSKR